MTETAPLGDESVPVEEADALMPMLVERADEPMPVAGVEYTRSPMIDHTWIGHKSARVDVSFCVTYSAAAAQSERAAETMSSNWEAACVRARSICENASLFEEAGRVRCEEMLCAEMTEILFATGDGHPVATVERVIWKRLVWR